MLAKKVRLNISSCSFFFLLVLVVFSGYFENTTIWNIACILCLMALSFFNGPCRISNVVIIEAGLLLITVVANLIASTDHTYMFANIRSLLYGISALFSLYIICKKDKNLVINMLLKCFVPFNILYIINLYVLYEQVSGNPIFIKTYWMRVNPYYPDLCAGTFGINSTNLLALYIIFIVLYNHMYAQSIASKIIKRLLRIYNIVTLIAYLYLCTLNDANLIYVLLPLFVTGKIVAENSKKLSKIQLKIKPLISIVAIVILFIVVIRLIPALREYINDTVMTRLTAMFADSNNSRVNGSTERLAIAYYGLENTWGWLLGKGIGSVKWQMPGAFGFNHFGLSSVGAFINIMGIWFYLMYCLFFSSVIYEITDSLIKTEHKLVRFGFIYLIIVLLSCYTYLFTGTRLIVMLTMLLIIIFLTVEKKQGYLDSIINS